MVIYFSNEYFTLKLYLVRRFQTETYVKTLHVEVLLIFVGIGVSRIELISHRVIKSIRININCEINIHFDSILLTLVSDVKPVSPSYTPTVLILG